MRIVMREAASACVVVAEVARMSYDAPTHTVSFINGANSVLCALHGVDEYRAELLVEVLSNNGCATVSYDERHKWRVIELDGRTVNDW